MWPDIQMQETAAQDGKTRALDIAIIGAGERGICYAGTRMAGTLCEM
ncbi:hypothetical protein WNZ15_15855 [Roseibium sp. AS2]